MSRRGRKNIYLCPHCGRGFVTIDIDEGITPFMLRCLNGCGNMAYSLCYQVPQALLETTTPAVEFYKPSDLTRLSEANRVHVGKGGLLMRERLEQNN